MQTYPTGTGSKVTRVLGIVALVMVAIMLLLALVISPPEISQGETVRLFYIHVPSAIVSLYIAFGITLLGSIIHLYNGSKYWDLVAGAAAEVGVVFLTFTLLSGMLWGRPTWGTYWTWDPRITSTAISLVLYIGYLAVRNLDMDPVARSRRAAVLGIISFANVIIVRYSVQWWRSLHQGSTIDPIDTQMDDMMLSTFAFSAATMFVVFAWMLIHRFRIAWLQEQVEASRLDVAMAERQRESTDSNVATGGA